MLLINSLELISLLARSPEHAGSEGGVATAAPATGDPWRPSDGLWVGPVELLQERGVRKVGAGNPRAVLQPITHPVHQVVEPLPTATDLKDPVDLPDQIALEGMRQWWSRGRRRQSTGGHQLDLGNVEDWMYLERGGKGESEGRGVDLPGQ